LFGVTSIRRALRPRSDASDSHETLDLPVHRVRRWMGICLDGWPFVGGAATLTLLGGWLGGWPWAVVPGLATFFTAWFFRDPERSLPSEPGGIVSPADGRVIDVRRVPYPRLLPGEATRVSIFMSVFNVHVNRVPYAGRVRQVHSNPGKFFAAFAEKASLENEQTAVCVDTDRGVPLLFVQIAGLIARRIVCRLAPAERVQTGERFGLIRFGSRTDIYLPDDVEIRVKVGDRVSGGASVIGVFR